MIRLLTLLLDLVLPGVGALLAGRTIAGAAVLAAWTIALPALAVATCIGALDPVRAGLATGVVWTSLQVLLAIGSSPHPGRPAWRAAGVGAVASLAALSGSASALAAAFVVVEVPDLSAFPGLVPGERILVQRSDWDRAPPDLGDLVYARTRAAPVLARVAGVAGAVVDVAGPSLSIDGAVVEAREEGEARVDPSAGGEDDETASLHAWIERLGDRAHYVFYRRGADTVPTRQKVPDGHVFLIADNRSTQRAADSRTLTSVPVADLVGRPVQVVWSPGRPERIGFRWP
ncbi:MAG: signal peptidase I [Deltaproteobacteria bacterium]|nr:signal peptidase I [Deltaproteobacteria bacterium]